MITLSGNFALELENQPSTTDYLMENDGAMISQWQRTETTEATNPKYQFELQYKRDFEDHEDYSAWYNNFYFDPFNMTFSDPPASGQQYFLKQFVNKKNKNMFIRV
mgnify:CR=1 FL=1